MGCCVNKYSGLDSFLYCKKLQEAIERGNLKGLLDVRKRFPDEPGKTSVIDETFITINDLNMSPLAYSLWLDKASVFNFLHKKMGASLETMEELLLEQGKKAIDLICLKGSLDILKSYLPHFLKNLKLNQTDSSAADIRVSVDFQRATLVRTNITNTYTPIQIACENRHINIVNFLYNHFKDQDSIPQLFDINYQDEKSGENCALIACRRGDYEMAKFLFEICKANFRVCNKSLENAVLIAAAASKKQPAHDFYNLFVYLVEAVQLDFTYMHEEVMLLLEDKRIIMYYEKLLQQKGIASSKNNVEKKYEINRKNLRTSDQGEAGMGSDFELRNCVELSGDYTRSILSSIHDNQTATPFMSILSFEARQN